jgi:tetratricopeptide (TPR) repeat protein
VLAQTPRNDQLLAVHRHWIVILALALCGCGKVAPARRAAAPPLPARLTWSDDTMFRPLRVPARDPFGYPANLTDKPGLIALARSGQYEALDHVLDSLEAELDADIRSEYRFWDAFQAFFGPDPALEAPLNAWVAERPASAQARIARATYYEGRAWASRGEGSAGDTPDSSLRGMDRYLDLASRDAAAGLRIDSTHLAAYTVQLAVAQLYGRLGEGRQVLTTGLRSHPASYVLRERYMNLLEPRWGGSDEAMEMFARNAAEDSARNPRLAALQGAVHDSRAYDAYLKDDYAGAVSEENQAIAFGAEREFLMARGRAYYFAYDYIRALDDLERALQQRPQHREVLLLHARVLYYMSTGLHGAQRTMAIDRAISEYELLSAIDPTDADASQWLVFLRQASRCEERDAVCRRRTGPT